jgi:hypothetical protein
LALKTSSLSFWKPRAFASIISRTPIDLPLRCRDANPSRHTHTTNPSYILHYPGEYSVTITHGLIIYYDCCPGRDQGSNPCIRIIEVRAGNVMFLDNFCCGAGKVQVSSDDSSFIQRCVFHSFTLQFLHAHTSYLLPESVYSMTDPRRLISMQTEIRFKNLNPCSALRTSCCWSYS